MPGGPVELRVYPGADADFTLYEDAGDGYGYENGEFALTPIHWDEASRALAVGSRQGTFHGIGAEHEFRVIVVDATDLG
jgi:alpha-D-xyloside xylohydrolase